MTERLPLCRGGRITGTERRQEITKGAGLSLFRATSHFRQPRNYSLSSPAGPPVRFRVCSLSPQMLFFLAFFFISA